MIFRSALLFCFAVGSVQAQTKWDMPTPYSEGEFHTRNIKQFADNVPFVSPGYDNAWKFYQAQKPVLEKKLQGRGLKLLYAVAWPGQGLYTRDPIKTLEDLKGQKMRTYSPLTSRLAELLGATGVQTQVTDVPQMFATGAMQAMVTSS